MTPAEFSAWLEVRGIIITRQYCSMILRQGAGPRFNEVFQQVTGVKVVKGLVEKSGATARKRRRLHEQDTASR